MRHLIGSVLSLILLAAAGSAGTNPVIAGAPPQRPVYLPGRGIVSVVVEVRDSALRPSLAIPRGMLARGRRVALADSPSRLVCAGLALSLLLALGGLRLVRGPRSLPGKRAVGLLLAALVPLGLAPLVLAKARLPEVPPLRLNLDNVEIQPAAYGSFRLVLPRDEADRLRRELTPPVPPAPGSPGNVGAMPPR
jgi:hypothetical protein